MLKDSMKLGMLAALMFGLVACSEDPADTNTPDMTVTPVPDMTVTPEPDMTVTPGPDMTVTPEPDMTVTPEPDMAVTPDPNPVTCDTKPRPARCDADPNTYSEWAPASVVSELKLVGDSSCCFDYNGDGTNDNFLGTSLNDLGAAVGFSVADANAAIADAIANGAIALLLEHEGVALTGGDFAINFFLGDQDGEFTAPDATGNNLYKINPSSFDEGVWPQARIGNAKLTGTSVTGGPGTVAIAIELFGATLNLKVSAARVTATVAEFDATTGVKLTNGTIGGVIRIDDLIESINNFATINCGCVQKDGAPITPPLIAGNVIAGYTCPTGISTMMCDTNDDIQSACKSIVDQCGTAASILPILADIELARIGEDCIEDGTCDSTSVGLTFEAVGAKITGVAAAP